MRRWLTQWTMAAAVLPLSGAMAQLVSEGPDGLIYSPYANQGQINAVNTVPDYSRAGYGGGGVPIPFVPAAVTLSPSGGNDTTAIQQAINTVSALPLGAGGFRGAVVLGPGNYTVSSTLTINASGVVIRGAGSQETGGTRITYTATTQSNLFAITGSGGPSYVGSSERSITDAYVPVGAKKLNVSSSSGYVPGDLIRITNLMNQKWIDDIGMTVAGGLAGAPGDPAWDPASFQLTHYRYVVAVNGLELTLDAPIVQAIETQYGGGKVQRFTYNNAIRNVGIEAIRLESTYASDTDENHGWRAIEMRRVVNGWVRQVTSRYFGMGLILVDDSSQFITVEDSACLDPKSVTTGGRKYSFNIDDSSYVLMQRNLTRGGRHDYVSGSVTPGPNVFVDSLATEALSDIGPHFRYATGELYDNIKSNNEIRVQNRLNSGTSHGWSGAQIMFWNVVASGIGSDTPVGAMNWTVGSVGTKKEGAWVPEEPFGIWESHNTPVLPRSLHHAQLRDRLGERALQNVILPAQVAGNLWTQLEAWGGGGLLLDGLVTWREEASPMAGVPVAILGVIRDLPMQETAYTVAWSKVSGPGAVSFGDSTAFDTTVTIAAPGNYVLQLTVSNGTRQLTSTLEMTIGGGGDITPPAPPSGLTASSNANRVTLQWTPNLETDLASYSIYRRLANGSFGAALITGVPSNQYEDLSAVQGTTYDYAVTALDNSGNESLKSNEASVTVLPPNLSRVSATNNAYIRAADTTTVKDVSQNVLVQRSDWQFGAKEAFLRFPISGDDQLGGFAVNQIQAITLDLFITANIQADTLRVYALIDNTQASPSHLTESTWTGGTAGTQATGGNLTPTNRPDGSGTLPKTSYSTVLLGSLTFPADVTNNNALGLQQISITELEVLKNLIRNDSNGQMTLVLTGVKTSGDNSFASVFNTGGNPAPRLSITAQVNPDADNDGIADAWEIQYFGAIGLIDGSGDDDGDGVRDFFEYLYGSNPTDAADGGFRFAAESNQAGNGVVFRWEVLEQFVLGTHYDVRISTNLTQWDPIPVERYTLQQTSVTGGRTRSELTLTHDYGDRVFLWLVKSL